jgi:hypothetical protein
MRVRVQMRVPCPNDNSAGKKPETTFRRFELIEIHGIFIRMNDESVGGCFYA